MQLDKPLWHYISAVYSRPGVEATCLEAQRLGLQVNSLLFCGWLAQQRKIYASNLFNAVEAQWRDPLLKPLRSLRYQLRELKLSQSGLTQCYESMKETELALEKVDIAMLWQASHALPVVTAPVDTADLARQNMLLYARSVSLEKDDLYQVCCESLVQLIR